MRGWPAVGIVLFLLLAGCASKSPDSSGTPSATASGTVSATGATSSTTSRSPGGANQPPAAALVASAGNGTASLNVTFAVTVSDPDGDALNWTLSFGDATADAKGTALKVGVAHAYAVAGRYNVTLTASDGTATATARASLNLTAPGPAAPTGGQELVLAWSVGATDKHGASAPTAFLNCESGPNEGVTVASFTLDAATVGLPFKATITDASGGGAIASWGIFFNLEDCSDYAGTYHADGAAAITGTVPEDAGPFVFLLSTGGVEVEVLYQSGSKVTA